MRSDKYKFPVSLLPSAEIRTHLPLGSVVRAVVIQRLADDTALITVRGMSTVAVSPLPLLRGQVLYAQVAEIGQKVHLRLVPPRQVRAARRTTTAAELARHLASLGIEPTDAAVRLAAAMLSAELSITADNVAAVSSLVADAGRDDDATAAAAAYVVRHGLSGDPRTTDSVRAALFEPPCLGELLSALEAAIGPTASSDTPAPAGEAPLLSALDPLLRRVRLGGPSEWLTCAVELCTGPASTTGGFDGDWLALVDDGVSARGGELGEIATRLHAVLVGLRVANEVGSAQPARVGWVLQVPFVHERALATAFVELSGPAGLALPPAAPADCEVRAWAPLVGDGEASCELTIRRATAHGTLRLTGQHDPSALATAAHEWITRELQRVGIELSSLTVAPDEDEAIDLLPTVGLDFQA